MKKSNVRKLILMVVVITALCIVSSVNYATGNVNDLIENITELPSNGNNVANTNTNTNNYTNEHIKSRIRSIKLNNL